MMSGLLPTSTATVTATATSALHARPPSRRSILLYMLLVSSSATSIATAAAALTAQQQQPIRRVVVAGGTHGNEYTGVWCVHHLEEQGQRKQLRQRFPSLSVETVLANPKAFHQNRRFVDTDLNREFALTKLHQSEDVRVEAVRARQLNARFGPKEDPVSDLIIDLHTTTSSMGVTIIVSERDHLMAQAAAHVLKQMQQSQRQTFFATKQSSGTEADTDQNCPSTNRGSKDEVGSPLQCQILMHAIPDRMLRPNLGSIARHALTIEVGPVPQGVLRHDAVEHTLTALYHVLDFVEHRNQHDDTYLTALEEHYRPNNHCVPCFRSAPAVAKGELSGKIPWPSHPTNPNFPAYMIHEKLQDRDFELVRTGDPLFVDLAGNVIPYRGSHGDSVYLMFINEGGYYYAESGTGIGVAVQSSYVLHTGSFADEDDCVPSVPSDIGNFEQSHKL